MSWASFFNAIFSLLPRPFLCRSTHAGLRFKKDGSTQIIAPGLQFYWPLVTEIELLPTVRQSSNLPPQSLLTEDGVAVTASLVVTYTVDDIRKALGESWEVDKSVEDVGSAAAVKIIAHREFKELAANLGGSIGQELTEACRKLLRPFGIRVLKVHVTDFTSAQVVRLIGGHGLYSPGVPFDSDGE